MYFSLKTQRTLVLKHRKQAIGIEVEDAAHAYEQCIERCGSDGSSASVRRPTRVTDVDGRGGATISEVRAYGDVVLRFISFEEPESKMVGEGAVGGDADGGGRGGGFEGAFLPNFVDVQGGEAREDFGLQRADHIVGNVWDMLEQVRALTVLCVTVLRSCRWCRRC